MGVSPAGGIPWATFCLKGKSQMQTVSKLQDEYGQLLTKINALAYKAKTDGWTAEDHQEFKRMDERQKKVCAEIQSMVDAQKLANEEISRAADNAPVEGSRQSNGVQWRDSRTGREVRVFRPSESVAAYFRETGRGGEDMPTLGQYLRSMIVGPKTAAEKRALSEGSDSAGGYTVPTFLMGELIDLLRPQSVIYRAGARTVPLETNVTKIARLASDPTAAWRSENSSVSESAVTFESVSFDAQTLAVLVKCSRELAEDSVNLDSALSRAFAGSLGGELDRVALFGSGTPPEPRGIVNTTNVNSVDLAGAALTSYDKFLDAIQLIYEDNGNFPTAAIMAPRTAITLEKLKQATTNASLERPPLIKDLPFLVTSRVPITDDFDDSPPSENNGSKIILGDFPRLLVGIRSQLNVQVLKERFSDDFQYGFLASLRADIALEHPESFAQIKGIIP